MLESKAMELLEAEGLVEVRYRLESSISTEEARKAEGIEGFV